MAKGKSRRGREEKKPKQEKKAAPVAAPAFGKALSIETMQKTKKA